MSQAQEVTDQTFNELVLNADQPVLVDFWAPWCPPCRQMGPVIDQIADEVAGAAAVYKLNVDDNPATAAKYGVSSIPQFIIFKDGEEAKSVLGACPKKTLLDPLRSLIG